MSTTSFLNFIKQFEIPLGRPKKSDQDRRSRQLTVRLTEEDLAAIEAAAAAEGVATAEWVRTASVAGATQRALLDELAAARGEIDQLRAEVIRQSGVLGQHVDAIRRAGFEVSPSEGWRLELVPAPRP